MRSLLLFFLLLTSLFVSAQKEGQELADSLIAKLPAIKIDTLKVNALNELAFTYQNIDPEIGKNYGYQALILAKKSNWKDGMAVANKNIGINHSVLGNFNTALDFYKKALEINPSPRIVTKILLSTGLIYTYQSNYPKALEYNMRALKISENLGDRKSMAAVLSNTGIIYYDLADYPKAIEFYNRALKINKEMGNKAYMSVNLGNLGNAYSDIGQFEKSIAYKKQAIAINDQLGDKVNKSINLGSIANSYFNQRKFDEALEYANASLKIDEETDNDRNIANNLGLIGDIYLESAKAANGEDANLLLDKAITNFNKALTIQTELRIWKEIAFNYDQLSEAEQLKGNYEKALDFSRSSSVFKDSVYNETSKETIKNLEDQRTIELRDKEIQLNKLTIESREKQRLYFLGGIILLILMMGMALRQSRNRKRTNKKLQLLNSELDQANTIKTRFFSILNHDLRSPVSNLIQLLHLQRNNPEMLDGESRTQFENKAISSAENLLESMEDILLWSKGQMENFKPQFHSVPIATVFEDIEKHFSDHDNIQLYFENPTNLQMNTDADFLKTIMRNLTANAIKVLEKSPTPTIIWKAWNNGKNTLLSIKDNGPGESIDKFRALYDDKEVVGITTGLGLHLIRDLAKAINCRITVDSNESGTTFILLFP